VKVLALTPELPYAPGGTGGSTRQFHLLKALVAAGHEVRCIAPVHPAQREGAERLRAAGVQLDGAMRPVSRVREAAGALLRRPELAARALTDPVVAWQVEVFWASLRQRAVAAVSGWRPDVVTVEHDWAARWSRDLPGRTPAVLTLENLSWAYYDSRAAATDGLRAACLRYEARRFARFDGRYLADHDLLIAVSEQDRRDARAVTATRCEVVPNGVDTSTFVVAADPGDRTCIFTGTLGYAPNAEAARWLLSAIWPRVLDALPDARLLIVGPDPPEDIRAAAGPAVEVAGWVRSIPEWMARASVALVPIRSGGGTRLKVLDALASGKAVVSTSVGAGGIELVDGRDAVLADDAEGFAAAVVRLLGEDGERARLAAAARQLAVERYDWQALGASFERLVRDLAA
jgi:polysaccharide biosynthesis protein PslH